MVYISLYFSTVYSKIAYIYLPRKFPNFYIKKSDITDLVYRHSYRGGVEAALHYLQVNFRKLSLAVLPRCRMF